MTEKTIIKTLRKAIPEMKCHLKDRFETGEKEF
jgi:hypothetical protein